MKKIKELIERAENVIKLEKLGVAIKKLAEEGILENDDLVGIPEGEGRPRAMMELKEVQRFVVAKVSATDGWWRFEDKIGKKLWKLTKSGVLPPLELVVDLEPRPLPEDQHLSWPYRERLERLGFEVSTWAQEIEARFPVFDGIYLRHKNRVLGKVSHPGE